MKALNFLKIKCFILINNYLFFYKRFAIENQKHYIQKNAFHHNAQMSLFDFVFNNQLRIKTNNRLMKLFSQHFFFQRFMIAYERNYVISIKNFEKRDFK